MFRGAQEGLLEGGCGIGVAEGRQADVLPGDPEAVAVGLHVGEDHPAVGRNLVAEVVAIAHVLGSPARFLMEVAVIDEGAETGRGAVLICQGEEELLVAVAERAGRPGVSGARGAKNGHQGKHDRDTHNSHSAQRRV